MNKSTYNLLTIRQLFLAIIAIFALPVATHALDLGTYAQSSRLAEGEWVKISVPETGLYAIPEATLRSWGFSDPSKVRVYGYGGGRIPNILNAENYVDDLPQVQQEFTSQGLVFYGVGPDSWVTAVGSSYRKDLNVYTSNGFYFLSQTADEPVPFETKSTPGVECAPGADAPNPTKVFTHRIHHEQELTAPGEAGYVLVGEDFRAKKSYSFSFPIIDKVEGTKMWMEASIITKTYNSASTVEYTVNGTPLDANSSDRINATTNSGYFVGTEGLSRHNFNFEGDRLDLNVSYSSPVTVHGAWINYIAINHQRYIKLPSSGTLNFWVNDTKVNLAGIDSNAKLHVWDVTNPGRIYNIDYSEPDRDGNVLWTSSVYGQRSYVAWTEQAKLPAPSFVERVVNQNLHASPCADMVIFTLPEFTAQAERIAEMHRNEQPALSVNVVNVYQVYNEFASGSADVSALRKYLKMLYDRGAAEGGTPLRYALIMGRATYDTRHITPTFKALKHGSIPYWIGGTVKAQLNDNDGFGTDDFIAMLDDNSGRDMNMDNLSIAVGRMPVRTANEARNAVDKLVQYVQSSPKSQWKNNIMILADDEDNGVHMLQAENMFKALNNTPNQQHLFNKIYIDAYSKVGGCYPEARNAMFRNLNEGVVWWTFIGHANNHSWTGDGQLTYDDINNMFLTRIPVLYAATCDFLRWDSNTLSGGEIFFHERYGGTIATISATRPVYIADNGYFSNALGRAVLKRDENGRFRTIGEIYQSAKNDIRNDKGTHISNANRLRYVLMGDPAMRLATPSNIVVLESIDDQPVDIENQVTLKALQHARINGYIADPTGALIDDFDGSINVTLYDAENSVTSNGNGEGEKVTFDQYGNKLFAGAAKVSAGRFELNITMPAEVADNFRPATLDMYAYASNSDKEAIGVNRDFYVYGIDEQAPEDTEAPSIDTMVLNHSTFSDGDAVNETPMLIASVSDNVAINMALSGIGHQITLTLDDRRTFADASMYYTPSADGSPSGVVNYPLPQLTKGPHTLRMKVWDTSGNSASREISFFVKEGLTPQIFDIYCDANPARTQTNFYLSHNRPDAMVTVTVTVYNLLGQPVWSESVKGRSDMFISSPVTWDLCDNAGRRVQRGIYLYRAEITTDGQSFSTGSRKIAVAAP